MSETPSKRLDSIDFVRGLVMVIMALDHVKGNFAYLPFDPIDLSKTTPAFFLTRCVAQHWAELAAKHGHLQVGRIWLQLLLRYSLYR